MNRNNFARCWPRMTACANFAVVLLATMLSARGATATLTIDTDKPGHEISPMLYGIFFEDINCSADGGLYAEMVRNRNFEDADTPVHWSTVSSGGSTVTMTVDTSQPVTTGNRRALR